MTVRLFCLPYAGAGATLYSGFRSVLPPSVELHTPQLPGREERIADEPFTDFWSVVSWLERTISGYGSAPVALFGHSMGAALAFETARSLAAAGGRLALLAVSGLNAPQYHRPADQPGTVGDDELRRRIRATGTDADRLFDDPVLSSLFVPALRADYQLLDGYRYFDGPPLSCPISVWGGRDDPMTSPAHLADWQQHSHTTIRLRMVDGGHLFIRDPAVAVARDLGADIEEAVALL